MKKHTTFDGPRSLRQIARILAVLTKAGEMKAPMSTEEIAEELCVCTETARLYLVHLTGQKTDRKVRICNWQLSGQRYMALYALGSRKNVPQPKAKTKAERHQAMMADPVAHAKENTRRRNWRRSRKGLPPIAAPWCAALTTGPAGGA